jgi:hypothetical protein
LDVLASPPAHPRHPTRSPYLSTDTFIQKTKKLYLDTRTQRNLAKLNQDIAEVHSIMTRNIQEVLGQGERLDSEHGQPGRAAGRAAANRSTARRRQRWPISSGGGCAPACWPAGQPLLDSLAPTVRREYPLAEMTEMSNMLSADARQFAVKAKDLYRQALLRKYLPLAVVVLVLGAVLLVRRWYT